MHMDDCGWDPPAATAEECLPTSSATCSVYLRATVLVIQSLSYSCYSAASFEIFFFFLTASALGSWGVIYVRSEVRDKKKKQNNSERIRHHSFSQCEHSGGWQGEIAWGKNEQVLRRMPNVIMRNLVMHQDQIMRWAEGDAFCEVKERLRKSTDQPCHCGKRETGSKLALMFRLMGKRKHYYCAVSQICST